MAPNIIEYSSTGEITPSDKGIQAAELAGRRLGLYGHELAEDVKGVQDALQQHLGLIEVSHIAKNFSDGEAVLADSWSQLTSDPNLKNRPDLASTFMREKVEPFIEQMQGLAGTEVGKQYALATGDRIRQQFWRETAGDQATINGHVVSQNADRVGNNATVSVARDPSQINYDAQAKNIHSTADYMSSLMPERPGEAGRREEWRENYIATHMHDLNVSRYQSMAAAVTQDVAQTGDASKSAAYDEAKKIYAGDTEAQNWVKGPEWVELGRQLDEAVNRGREQYNAADAAQRRKDSEDFESALLPIETGMFKPNGAGGVTMAVTPDVLAEINRIAAMPGAKQHAGEVRDLLNAVHQATQDQLEGKERVSDHGIYTTLSSRIGSTTSPLTKAEVDQNFEKLSTTDYHFLRDAASDSKTANPKINHALTELHRWQEQVKPMIDKSNPIMGSLDQQGTEKFSVFAWDSEQALRRAIASGEDPDRAVERLTDPRNPRGFYHFIPQYQTTTKSTLDTIVQITKPGGVQPIPAPPGGVRHDAVPPRMPGESFDAYDKRVHQ